MFLGKHAARLDGQNRFTVPVAFMSGSQAGLVLMQGLDRNLMALTPHAFDAIYEQARSLNLTDPAARMLLRLVLGTAQPTRPDSQGALEVPAGLSHYAALRDELTLVGQGEMFEIWAAEIWQAQETLLQDANSNSMRFSSLNLATR